jgi:hypothetical protein
MDTQDPIAGLAIIGWVAAGLFLLIVAICIAAKRGSLSLNHMIGLRVPALMRDEKSWQVGHAAALAPALISLAVATAFDLVGIASALFYWGAVAMLVAGLIWIVVRASRAAVLAESN